jgi:pimeloyl-ACP methyl ester carboxylesterase
MTAKNPAYARAIFLHWGPGGNAEVERRWFGKQTAIDFWDQPKLSGPRAYDELVSAAEARLGDLCALAQGPIHLIAHSFGSKIAQTLAERAPEKISGLTLLAAGHDPWKAYIQFAYFLSAQHNSLKALAQQADRSRQFDELWGLLGTMAQIPDVQRLYWKNEKARLQYQAFASGLDLVDFGCLAEVLKGFADATPALKPLRLKSGVRVRCVLGANDPLQNTAEEADAWKSIFPGCEISVLPNVGHFVHFESAPSQWLGELTSSFQLGT